MNNFSNEKLDLTMYVSKVCEWALYVIKYLQLELHAY